MFAELINDGDVDLNVTKVVLNSLRVWKDMNGGMVLQANNITADNDIFIKIFVKADHYVEYTFNVPPPMDMSHLARNPPKNVTKRTFASKIRLSTTCVTPAN